MTERTTERHRQRVAAPFPGFRRPTYTQVPDEFFDIAPGLLERHLKIMLYVMRRTFGFKKSADRISISQFLDGITTRDGRRLDRGCGLSKKPLLEGLKELETAGLLTVVRTTNRHDGHAVNEYELHLRPDEPNRTDGLHDFGGFRKQVKYVQVPDELFDVLLPDLSAGELKLLLFIIRQTQGFGRESVALARREILDGIHATDGRPLAQGAGIGERHLKEAKKRLRASNIIETEERRSPDGRGEATLYRLKVLSSEQGGAENAPRGVQEIHQGGGTSSAKGGVASLPRRGVPSPPPLGGDSRRADGEQTPPNNKQDNRTVQHETLQQQDGDGDVVALLYAIGVTRKTAEALAHLYPAERILAQIDMLPLRHADNPPAMLVRAIQEDWATPPGYGKQEPDDYDGVWDTVPVHREKADEWRERTISQYHVDAETQASWEQVRGWVPTFAGRASCPDWLDNAVLLPPGTGYAEVLLPEMMHRQAAEREYREAVEDALATVLRRRVKVRFRYAP